MARITLVTLCVTLTIGTSTAADETARLVVGIKEAPPFVIREPDGWSGIAIELWHEVAEELDVGYELREMDLSGLLRAVERGEVDVAVGALTVTAERESRVDFTHPYFTAGLGIAVRGGESMDWLGSLRRFASVRFLKVMGTLAGVLLLSGLLVWLFERRKNPEMFGGTPAQGVGAGFWWAAVTMTTVGYGDKAPLTVGGRIVALFWMFASLVVISGFTAAIASALTIGGMSSPIQGPEDLPNSRVASVDRTISGDWLRANRIRYTAHHDVQAALGALAARQADAVVYDMPILHYLAQHDAESSIHVVPRRFEIRHYALAVPQGSGLRERLNQTLPALIRGPEWSELRFRYTGERW
jgi:ABC-type amino acid transport substrate-binding protein